MRHEADLYAKISSITVMYFYRHESLKNEAGCSNSAAAYFYKTSYHSMHARIVILRIWFFLRL